MPKGSKAATAEDRVDDLPASVDMTGGEILSAFSALRGMSNPARDGDKATTEIRPDYLEGYGSVKFRVFQLVRTLKPHQEKVNGALEDARMGHTLTDQRGVIQRDADGDPVIDEKGYFADAKKAREKKYEVTLPDGPLLASHLGQELVDTIPGVYIQDLGQIFEWDQPYDDLPETVGNRSERRKR